MENIENKENHLELIGEKNIIHDYHSECINEWFKKQYTNPLTKKEPNYIFQ